MTKYFITFYMLAYYIWYSLVIHNAIAVNKKLFSIRLDEQLVDIMHSAKYQPFKLWLVRWMCLAFFYWDINSVLGPPLLIWINLNPACINDCIHYKVWDDPFLTSTVQRLKFVNGKAITYHILLGISLLIYARIQDKPFLLKGPWWKGFGGEVIPVSTSWFITQQTHLSLTRTSNYHSHGRAVCYRIVIIVYGDFARFAPQLLNRYLSVHFF